MRRSSLGCLPSVGKDCRSTAAHAAHQVPGRALALRIGGPRSDRVALLGALHRAHEVVAGATAARRRSFARGRVGGHGLGRYGLRSWRGRGRRWRCGRGRGGDGRRSGLRGLWRLRARRGIDASSRDADPGALAIGVLAAPRWTGRRDRGGRPTTGQREDEDRQPAHDAKHSSRVTSDILGPRREREATSPRRGRGFAARGHRRG